jgi:hypothetical protein
MPEEAEMQPIVDCAYTVLAVAGDVCVILRDEDDNVWVSMGEWRNLNILFEREAAE